MEKESQKKFSIFDWLFVETPFILSVVLSIASALGVFYLLMPKHPKVVYMFDAEKFKNDLMRKATVSGTSPQTVSIITSDLKRMLDELADREKTVVINRRALISSGLANLEFVDITDKVENALFSRYFPGVAGTKEELFRRLKENKR